MSTQTLAAVVGVFMRLCALVFPFAATYALWNWFDNKAACIAVLCVFWTLYVLFVTLMIQIAKAFVKHSEKKEPTTDRRNSINVV